MVKNNQNGFSLLEILAVLVLSSVVLIPMLTSFTDNLNANRQSLESRKAVSIVESSLNGIDKIDFIDYRDALDSAYLNGDRYLELNEDDCSVVFTDPVNIAICDSVFGMTSVDLTLDSSTYRMFLFDFNLTTAEHNALVGDTSLPEQVRGEIETNQDILDALNDPDDIQNLIWVVVWVDYFDNPDRYIINTTLIANNDPDYFE
jgi:prepilin-type N-terminal cleavage/methylation domain-containing protein